MPKSPTDSPLYDGLTLAVAKDSDGKKPSIAKFPSRKVSLKEMAELLGPEQFKEFVEASKIDIERLKELLGPEIFEKLFKE